MLVRFDKSVCGERFVYNRRTVHDLPDVQAKRFIAQGRAHALDTEQANTAPSRNAMKDGGGPRVSR